jgi:hypothetical protein
LLILKATAMSLFQWFSKSKAVKPQPLSDSSGLENVDATLPQSHGTRGNSRPQHAGPAGPAERKSERLERRELLYAVVRESMTRAGILSSGYKFKVLSLDSRGRQYLIMMDVARQYVGDTTLLSDIESQVARSAKARHEILVTAMYWRINEHVSAGIAPVSPSATPTTENTSKPVARPQPKYEPLQADEVAAFKQALASVPSPKPLVAPGEIVRSGRRNPAPMPTFEDTELDDRASPLSGTQYGDLT